MWRIRLKEQQQKKRDESFLTYFQLGIIGLQLEILNPPGPNKRYETVRQLEKDIANAKKNKENLIDVYRTAVDALVHAITVEKHNGKLLQDERAQLKEVEKTSYKTKLKDIQWTYNREDMNNHFARLADLTTRLEDCENEIMIDREKETMKAEMELEAKMKEFDERKLKTERKMKELDKTAEHVNNCIPEKDYRNLTTTELKKLLYEKLNAKALAFEKMKKKEVDYANMDEDEKEKAKKEYEEIRIESENLTEILKILKEEYFKGLTNQELEKEHVEVIAIKEEKIDKMHLIIKAQQDLQIRKLRGEKRDYEYFEKEYALNYDILEAIVRELDDMVKQIVTTSSSIRLF